MVYDRLLRSISALRTTAHTRTMAKHEKKAGKKPAAAKTAAPAAAQPPAAQWDPCWTTRGKGTATRPTMTWKRMSLLLPKARERPWC